MSFGSWDSGMNEECPGMRIIKIGAWNQLIRSTKVKPPGIDENPKSENPFSTLSF